MSFDAQIVFIPTADLERCARFYAQVLGLEMVLDQDGVRIYRGAGAGYLGFSQSSGPLVADDRLILTLVCDDVDGWYTRLDAAGITTDGPPRENERYRIYHFFARDPDGYRIEIQRFLHPFPVCV